MLDNLDDMASLDGLVLQHRLGDLVQGAAMFGDHLLRTSVLCAENQGDLLIDAPGGVLADVLGAGDVAAKENGILVLAQGHRA